jgi:hypothetical protein
MTMKKTKGKHERLVSKELPRDFRPERPERKPVNIGFEAYFQVRRHSRVLYLPLDATAVRLLDVQKGDIIKAKLKQLFKAPRADEPMRETRTKDEWEEEE